MLAHAEMKIATAVIDRLENTCAFKFEIGLVGRRQIGGTADQPWNVLCQRVQNFARAFTGGDPFSVCRERGQVFVPSIGKVASLHSSNLVREIRKLAGIASIEIGPLGMKLATTLPDAFLKMF